MAKNFFKEYLNLKGKVETGFCSEDIVNLYDALKIYLTTTTKWVKKDEELYIFNEYMKGTKDKDIAVKLNLTIQNYRVIMSRLTVRLNSQLLYGETLTDLTDATKVEENKQKIKDAISIIEQAIDSIDVSVEFKGYNRRGQDTEILNEKEAIIYSILAYMNSNCGKEQEQLVDDKKVRYYVNHISDKYSEQYRRTKMALCKSKSITELAENIKNIL